MDWTALLSDLQQTLHRRGRAFREIGGGLAINFDDGCDSLFVTPYGLRAVGISADQATPDGIADQFELLNRRRSSVLMALRHFAADNGVALWRLPEGAWLAQGQCWSNSINVGSELTRSCARTEPHEALAELLKYLPFSSPHKAPISELLARSEPPASEQPWRVEGPEPILAPGALAFDCSVLDEAGMEGKSPEELADALTRSRKLPGMAVVKGVIRRVGPERFSMDLLAPKGTADLEFTDKLDHMRLLARGRKMARLAEQHGVKGAIDKLVEEFQRLDRARTRVLGTVQTLMARQGFVRDVLGGWWFGQTHREFDFDPGEGLTLKLKKHSEAEVLSEWLESRRPFEPLPGHDELMQALEGPYVECPSRQLPLHAPQQSPPLPELGSYDLEALDRSAEELVGRIRQAIEKGKHLPGETRPLRLWLDRPWYYRGRDSWVDETWWVEVARRKWQADKNDQLAALILLANGDNEPREQIREMFSKYDYYEAEAFWDDLLWLFRDELPWPIDEGDELPTYSLNVGSPPPELARRLCMRVLEGLRIVQAGGTPGTSVEDARQSILRAAARLDPVAASEWLAPASIEQLHEVCRAWARSTDDFFALREDDPLETAINFRWADIADSLENNPMFTHAYLDDPIGLGQLDVGKLAARLTALASGPFAGRWAAHALNLDLEAELEKARREAEATAHGLKGVMTSAQAIKMSLFAHRSWLNEQQLTAAVAWWRWRKATRE